MASTEDLIQQYQQKRQKIMEMGGAAAIEKRHQAGQLSARERIDYLFDEGTFTEIGLFVKHRTTGSFYTHIVNCFSIDSRGTSAYRQDTN